VVPPTKGFRWLLLRRQENLSKNAKKRLNESNESLKIGGLLGLFFAIEG